MHMASTGNASVIVHFKPYYLVPFRAKARELLSQMTGINVVSGIGNGTDIHPKPQTTLILV